MNKSIASIALFGLFAFTSPGCQNNGDGAVEVAPNAPKPVAAPKATPSATDSTRLKTGAAPLSYLLGPGGPIHIVDATTGKTVAKLTAAPQAVITIDETKGISVANIVVKAGPLPAGHQYELWLDHQ